jgi:hypothetical protein
MMGDAMSEKETNLNYKIQPIARQFIDTISLIQLPEANDLYVFFSVNIF